MKLIYTLFLVISIGGSSFAQDFVVEGKTWNYINYVWLSSYTVSYKFEGDTTLYGQDYKKTWVSYDEQNTEWFPHPDYPFTRETPDKKVLVNYFGTERQLYDFNAVIGDTLFVQDYPFAEIIGIDSTELNNGELRKRWRLSTGVGADFFWIEGIGGTQSFLFEYYTDSGEELVCYEENGITLLEMNDTTCWIDFVGVNTNEMNADNFQFSVFPNPSKNNLNIQYKLPQSHQQVELTLLDLSGQVLEKIKPSSNQAEISQDVSHLSAGFYFCNLFVDGKLVSTKKWVKLE